MIAGNPKAGRVMVKVAIVLLVAITLVTIWVTSRKKSAPATEPPLHPSILLFVWGGDWGEDLIC
jgi:hypothetical protein